MAVTFITEGGVPPARGADASARASASGAHRKQQQPDPTWAPGCKFTTQRSSKLERQSVNSGLDKLPGTHGRLVQLNHFTCHPLATEVLGRMLSACLAHLRRKVLVAQ